MTCDISVDDYYALYTINHYACDAGYFLPANTLGCVACPSGFTCDGGTFPFNPDIYQGLDIQEIKTQTNNVCAANFPSDLWAIYIPKKHTCLSGYYLPANIDTCTLCPSGSACVGGTYSFNETIDQGIETCPNGTFSPTGSHFCYPHIMHVGNDNIYLKSTKQTTPSLNIKIGNTVFYANMTTIRTTMNKDSTHYLRVRWNDYDYYICDDTTCPQ